MIAMNGGEKPGVAELAIINDESNPQIGPDQEISTKYIEISTKDLEEIIENTYKKYQLKI